MLTTAHHDMKPKRTAITLTTLLMLPLGAAPLAAATRTWDGGGTTNDWNVAANWTSNTGPVAGDTLVFPGVINTIPVTFLPLADRIMNNNLAANTDIAGMTFAGPEYSLSGNTIDLVSGGIALTYSTAAETIIAANISIAGVGQSLDTGTGEAFLTLDGNLLLSGNSLALTGSGDLRINGQIANNTGVPILTKTGTGTATFSGFNNFSGDIEVEEGTLYAVGFIAGSGALNVRNGATLAGDDGGITKNTLIQGTLAPGSLTDPTLSMDFAGALTFSTVSTNTRTLHLDLRGITAGSSYDQIEAGGTVSLNSAPLVLEFSTFKPAVGTVFTLINKTSAGAISGTFSGVAQGSSLLRDGQLLQFSYTGGDGNDLTATVLNQSPVAAAQSVTTDEDTALAVTLAATDANPQTLTYTVVALPAHGTLTGTAPNLTYTPDPNYSGTDSFTFRANDGTVNGNTAAVSITVNAVNDAPSATGLNTAETYTEDAPKNLSNIVITDVDDTIVSAELTLSNPSAGILTTGATSKFNGVTWSVEGLTADVNAELAAVSFVPAPNFNGTFTIATRVSDGTASVSGTKTMTGTPVNDAPTVTNIPDSATNEDTATTIAFTVGDVETAAGSLSVTASSSNSGLVPAVVPVGGSGANRTLNISPALNQTGTTTITVTVSDGTTTATDTFVLTVNPVNDAPTISSIANRSTSEDTATPAIAFTVGDVETAADSLTITKDSSNTTLVPVDNIVIGGTGAGRTVTITPAANQTSTATITLTVSDGTTTAIRSFTLTVTSVNDIPAFTKGPNVKVPSNSGPATFAAWATDISDGDPEVAQALAFNVTSNTNSALFSVQPAISSTGALTFTPATGNAGTATITISLTDDATAGGAALTTATQSFTIRVAAPLSGTVTVGSGGTFPSLTGTGGLFEAINLGILSGDLTAHITGDLTETGLVSLNAVDVTPAGSTPVIRIHPTGAPRTITGTANVLIRLNGADRVIFDGSLNGTGSDRSLTVQNLSTSASSAVFWQQPSGSDGCTDNIFRNLIISGSTAGGQTFAGIGAGSSSINEADGSGHHRNTYRNNSFSGVRTGIISTGSTAAPNEDTLITGNEMIAGAPLHLRRAGILVLNENRPVISGNTIAAVSDTSTSDSFGISAGIRDLLTSVTSAQPVTNAQITGNRIRGVAQFNTFSAAGIALRSGSSGVSLVANNEVAGIEGNPVLTDIIAGIAVSGNTGSTTRVIFNSVSVSGSIAPNQDIASAESHFGIAMGSGDPAIELRNNAIRNEAVNLGVPARKSYAIGAASTAFTNLTASNNVYFTPAGTGFAFAKTGSLGRSSGTDQATLADWQSLTATDSASQFADPLFTSLLDLTPQSGSPLIGAGVPVAGVTTDINGATRSTTAPTVGAFGGDGGGLSALEQWRQTHFSTTANAGDAANDFDFDQDGLTNLVEFAFGQDPRLASSAALPQPLPVDLDADGTDDLLTLSFTTPPGVGGISYVGETSSTLAAESWAPVADSGSGAQHVFSIPLSAARGFLRVRIEAP